MESAEITQIIIDDADSPVAERESSFAPIDRNTVMEAVLKRAPNAPIPSLADNTSDTAMPSPEPTSHRSLTAMDDRSYSPNFSTSSNMGSVFSSASSISTSSIKPPVPLRKRDICMNFLRNSMSLLETGRNWIAPKGLGSLLSSGGTTEESKGKSRPGQGVWGGTDSFTKSNYVYGLKSDTFDGFLSRKDVVMVMFYNTKDQRSFWARPRFIEAAQTTYRRNHAYAAVNCKKEYGLCSREKISSTPTFRLYSKGHTIGTISDIQNFDADLMKKFVELSPLYDEPRFQRKTCDK